VFFPAIQWHPLGSSTETIRYLAGLEPRFEASELDKNLPHKTAISFLVSLCFDFSYNVPDLAVLAISPPKTVFIPAATDNKQIEEVYSPPPVLAAEVYVYSGQVQCSACCVWWPPSVLGASKQCNSWNESRASHRYTQYTSMYCSSA